MLAGSHALAVKIFTVMPADSKLLTVASISGIGSPNGNGG